MTESARIAWIVVAALCCAAGNFSAPPPGSAAIIWTRPLAFLGPTSAAPGVTSLGPRFNERDRDRDDFERLIAGTFDDDLLFKEGITHLWRLGLNPDGPRTPGRVDAGSHQS